MKKVYLAFAALVVVANANNFNPAMQTYIDELKVKSKAENKNFTDFNSNRGEKIFTSTHIGKKGKEISCASCHTKNLRVKGKNVHTGKIIDPLSPSANTKRLTLVKDVKKWLRRNFNDVYKRVGTAQEKGDVLYYINSK